ncbi:hypothetical protein VTH82DRAFT_2473 [Thermothelomyces myriococcoides]
MRVKDWTLDDWKKVVWSDETSVVQEMLERTDDLYVLGVFYMV